MKNIFILDEYITSQTNGIGTYINELLYCFKSSIHHIIHVVFNSKSKEFSIKNENGIINILYPCIDNVPFSSYPKTIIMLLKLYVDDSANNIFIINHSPCSELLKTTKKWFPLSKLIFVIHGMFWINALSGNYAKLAKVMSKKRSNNLAPNIKYLLKRVDEECNIFKVVDLVICLCEDTEKVLLEIYQVPIHKIRLIRNGLRDEFNFISENVKTKIRQKMHCDKDEKIIIYVGRINESKGASLLLKAFESILKIYPKLRLVLIGQFQLQNHHLKNVQRIMSKITLTGHIEKKELYAWYSIADIGILPSFYEQCSYAGIEMLMYGLPIVTTDSYGIRNMFCDKNSEVAMLSKVKTKKDKVYVLSQAILNVLTPINKGKKLSIAARESFNKKYEIIYFDKIYKKLIDNL